MLLNRLGKKLMFFDGGMGTLLQEKGLPVGELPESWNITHPETIKDIHKAYFDAGSNVVCTNTFGANLLKFEKDELENVITSAVSIAKQAKEESKGAQEKFIALDIGPLGKLLKPLGDLEFEKAVEKWNDTYCPDEFRRAWGECGANESLVMVLNYKGYVKYYM